MKGEQFIKLLTEAGDGGGGGVRYHRLSYKYALHSLVIFNINLRNSSNNRSSSSSALSIKSGRRRLLQRFSWLMINLLSSLVMLTKVPKHRKKMCSAYKNTTCK